MAIRFDAPADSINSSARQGLGYRSDRHPAPGKFPIQGAPRRAALTVGADKQPDNQERSDARSLPALTKSCEALSNQRRNSALLAAAFPTSEPGSGAS